MPGNIDVPLSVCVCVLCGGVFCEYGEQCTPTGASMSGLWVCASGCRGNGANHSIVMKSLGVL